MNLSDLAQAIQPARTVLLLGAGASVSSGAPSGLALSRMLGQQLRPAADGDDLAEMSGIFERRNGRAELARNVRDALASLQPTGGLLALPMFPWAAIYSTNFDRLVEAAYQKSNQNLNVVRSNFDFSKTQDELAPTLYKIHGCISQDTGFGDQAAMLLTEADYDAHEVYRQGLFASLRLHMQTKDTLIIGQSLRDRHLRDLAKEVVALRAQGLPGRVFLMAYEYDADRADLYEQRGIVVTQGSLEDLFHSLSVASQKAGSARIVYSSQGNTASGLTPTLVSSTTDVAHAANLGPNSVRLFNGWPATYADIRAGLTITRAVERRLGEMQQGTRGFFTVLTGAAGVGKTTLARALLLKRSLEGFACWEHSNSFPLDADAWLDVELTLRQGRQQGVLLVDDCGQHMKSVNRLIDGLGALERPFLRIVLTASASQWRAKPKSPYLFSRGSIERLSRLTDGDINDLVNLVEREPSIRELVQQGFKVLSREAQIRRLRERCSADMFVCLKNIFHNETLDQILLQEFAELEQDPQDVYRLVAALQAMGAKVHRQMVVRLLNIDAVTLTALLGQLEDVVSEYDISEREGIYGWSTRHGVVANVIATYKYADETELYGVLSRFIDGLNPAIHIERETARSMASNDMGISRLTSFEKQAELLTRLANAVPGERTPRRRLIRLHLDQGHLIDAEQAIKVAESAIGSDPIVDRYKCVLATRRAETVDGLMDEDRKAMLLEAERLAKKCVSRHPLDRYNYRVLADVGRSLAQRFADSRVLHETVELMRYCESDVLDPAFAEERGLVEESLRRFEQSELRRVSLTAEYGTPDDSVLADTD